MSTTAAKPLADRSLIMSGGSRGIGLEIAKRAAADGANITLIAKTDAAHHKLPGTIHTAAAELEEAGGTVLKFVGDVRMDDGATGQAFVDALTARLPGKTVDLYAVNYPASLAFGQAADGIADASSKIETIAASCPNTKIVLGGYSQGAAVAGYTTTDTVPAGFALPAGITGPMSPAIASHVAAVVLFGTPDSWFLNL